MTNLRILLKVPYSDSDRLLSLLVEVLLARVTVEDCLDKVGNRFALVILAAERARQLSKGARPLVQCDNKPAVTALREIAEEAVCFNEDVNDGIREYLIGVRARGNAQDHARR